MGRELLLESERRPATRATRQLVRVLGNGMLLESGQVLERSIAVRTGAGPRVARRVSAPPPPRRVAVLLRRAVPDRLLARDERQLADEAPVADRLLRHGFAGELVVGKRLIRRRLVAAVLARERATAVAGRAFYGQRVLRLQVTIQLDVVAESGRRALAERQANVARDALQLAHDDRHRLIDNVHAVTVRLRCQMSAHRFTASLVDAAQTAAEHCSVGAASIGPVASLVLLTAPMT